MKRKRIDIDKLNADQLRGFISVARRRLIEITADNRRLAENITGQESAKRAIQVAATGGHDVVFYGPSGAGADKLVILAAQFGAAAYAVECCPCGNYTDPKRVCECTPTTIRRHWNKVLARPEIRGAAIHSEVRPVPFRQMSQAGRGLPYDDMAEYIAGAGLRPVTVLSGLNSASQSLMRQATNALGFSADAVNTVLDVATSIAALDHSKAIEVHHLAEAIQYRRLDRPIFP